MNIDEFNRKIWFEVDRLGEYLEWSNEDFGHYLKMSQFELSSKRANNSEIPLINLSQFCSELGISIDLLLSGEVDLEWLKYQKQGKRYHIPSKFKKGSFSKIRTSSNVLKYLDDHYLAQSEFLLKRLGLSREMFLTGDESISINCLVEMTNYLKTQKMKEDEFINIGFASFEDNKGSLFAKKLSEFSSAKEIIEAVIYENSTSYDLNFRYEIEEMNSRYTIISERPTQEAQDALSRLKVGTYETELIKSGVLRGLPRYIDQKELEGFIVSSVHKGHDKTRYQLNF